MTDPQPAAPLRKIIDEICRSQELGASVSAKVDELIAVAEQWKARAQAAEQERDAARDTAIRQTKDAIVAIEFAGRCKQRAEAAEADARSLREQVERLQDEVDELSEPRCANCDHVGSIHIKGSGCAQDFCSCPEGIPALTPQEPRP